MRPKTLTTEEALRLAQKQILAMRETELSNAEILGVYTSVSEDENTLKVIQQVECIVNIAEEVKIEITPKTQE